MNYDQTYQDQVNLPADDAQGNNCEQGCFLAIASVPMQQWKGTYAVERGFQKGTIFPELDLPFLGREAR